MKTRLALFVAVAPAAGFPAGAAANPQYWSGPMEDLPAADNVLRLASCHDVASLQKAAALGLDGTVVGQVHATASHPGHPRHDQTCHPRASNPCRQGSRTGTSGHHDHRRDQANRTYHPGRPQPSLG